MLLLEQIPQLFFSLIWILRISHPSQSIHYPVHVRINANAFVDILRYFQVQSRYLYANPRVL